MVSIFDKAKDKLSSRKTPKDSDDESVGSGLSRNSSLSRSLRRKDKDKEKEKKRLSGLRYENKQAMDSKDSVALKSSAKSRGSRKSDNEKAVKKDEKSAKEKKQGKKKMGTEIDIVTSTRAEAKASPDKGAGTETGPETGAENGNGSSANGAGADAKDTGASPEAKAEGADVKGDSVRKLANGASEEIENATLSNPVPNRDDTVSPRTAVDPSLEAPIPVRANPPSNTLKEGYGTNGTTGDTIKPTGNNEPIAVVDENQPLLNRPPSEVVETSSYLSSPKLTIGVIIVLLVLVGIIYFTYKDLSDVIKQSVKPQLNAINLLALTNEGLEISIDSRFSINYDNISSVFYLNLYKLGGIMLSSVVLSPRLPINVQVNNLESFNITTPASFEIGLLNHKSTQLNFNSTIKVMDDNLIKLLNELLQNDEEMTINLKSNFHTDIVTRFLTLKNQAVSVDQDLIFNNNLSSLNSEVEVLNQSFSFDEKNTDEVGKSLQFKSLIKYNLTYFNNWMVNDRWFNIYLKDCQEQLNLIGELVMGRKEKKVNQMIIDGHIDEINQNLVECDSVNGLVHRLMNLESPELYLKSTTVDPDLPKWLNNILTNVSFKVPKWSAATNSSSEWHPDLNALNISHTSSYIHLEGPDKVFIDTNLTMANENVPIDITGINQHILTPEFSGSMKGDLVKNIFTGKFQLDVTKPFDMGKIIGKYFNNEVIDIKDMEVLINQLVLHTPIYEGKLTDLSLKHQSLTYQNPEKLGDIVDGLEINIQDLIVTRSDDWALDLEVLVNINSPLNLSLEIDTPIEFDLIFEGKSLGQVKIPNLVLLKDEPYMNIINLTIDKHIKNHKTLLKFVNGFISSSDAQYVNILFNKPDLLVNAHIDNGFKLPMLQFHDQPQQDEEDERKNPFVLEPVIHVVGSEVELLIYNPFSNMELQIYLTKVIASHDDKVLAETIDPEYITMPPGLNKTPRIPLKINSLGSKVLQKALNGDLMVNVTADFNIQIDKFNLDLAYEGMGVKSHIRL